MKSIEMIQMNAKNILSASFILLSVAAPASADEYQVEAGLSSWNYNATGYHTSEMQLDLSYYFDPVNTEDRPLAIAYYLGRNSNVYGYAYSDIAKHSSNGGGAKGEFWKNDFYLSANYDRIYGVDGYAANVGYMLNDGLLLAVGVVDGDNYLRPTYTMSAKYVGKIGARFVNIDAKTTSNSGFYNYTLGGDYFFSNAFSMGAEMRYADSTSNIEKHLIRGQYFLSSKTSISARFERYLGQDTTYVALSTRY